MTAILNRHWSRLLTWSWVFVLLGALCIHLLPTTLWYELRSVHVADAIAGGDPAVDIDRTIRRSVYGDWYLSVWQVNAAAPPTLHCSARGANNYRAGALRPRGRGLVAYWMDGAVCPLAEGRYFATISFRFYPPYFGTKTAEIDSNVFTVHPPRSSP